MSYLERQHALRQEHSVLQGHYDVIGLFIRVATDPDILERLGNEAGRIKAEMEIIQNRMNRVEPVLR